MFLSSEILVKGPQVPSFPPKVSHPQGASHTGPAAPPPARRGSRQPQQPPSLSLHRRPPWPPQALRPLRPTAFPRPSRQRCLLRGPGTQPDSPSAGAKGRTEIRGWRGPRGGSGKRSPANSRTRRPGRTDRRTAGDGLTARRTQMLQRRSGPSGPQAPPGGRWGKGRGALGPRPPAPPGRPCGPRGCAGAGASPHSQSPVGDAWQGARGEHSGIKTRQRRRQRLCVRLTNAGEERGP